MLKFLTASALTLFALTLLFSQPGLAGPETLRETCEVVMGENDSRAELRQLAFLQCKQRIAERVGTVVSSMTVVRDAALSHQEINSLTAVLLSARTTGERIRVKDDVIRLEIDVAAKINLNEAEENLKALLSDQTAQRSALDQQRQIDDLTNQIAGLRDQLSRASGTEARKIKQEQRAVIEEIQKIQSTRIQIRQNIDNLTESTKYVDIGFTEREIISTIGKYRIRHENYAGAGRKVICLNYGNYWLILIGGVYKCRLEDQVYHSCEAKYCRNF